MFAAVWMNAVRIRRRWLDMSILAGAGSIDRTPDSEAAAVENLGGDHGGLDVPVSAQDLDCAQVGAGFCWEDPLPRR